MRRALRVRLRIVVLLVVLVAALLVARLFWVQVVHAKAYAIRAQSQFENTSTDLYNRGSIYFTNKDGTLISAATLATGALIAIDPQHLTDPQGAYDALNAVVPIDHDMFFSEAAKTEATYEVVAHHITTEAARKIDALQLPGVQTAVERWRMYPAGGEGAQTIGRVAYNGDDDLTGLLGIEKQYNNTLDQKGNGVFGNFFAELFANIDSVTVNAQAAHEGDVITTIEPVVEEKLDQEIAATNAKYNSKLTGGIIMDPATGEIIALDTYPEFDPNHVTDTDTPHLENPLVESRYEFGSIMKTLTMASGLDAGVIQPDTTYDDTGCITVDQSKICNFDHKARGVIPMQQILSQSLNVGASFIATRLGHDSFRSYFTKLGLAQPTGIDLPHEQHGDIQNLNSPRDVEYDTASFGQGIAMTPVETIRALGALANHGAIVTPHLVKAIRLENGQIETLTWPKPVQVFSPSATDETTRMMVSVADNNLSNGKVKIPTMSMATKTGTAQIAGPDGKYLPNQYFHSFVGYFPASNPRFIILLYTYEPQGVEYASETLTQPFIDLTHFLINYYDIPPDRGTPVAQ